MDDGTAREFPQEGPVSPYAWAELEGRIAELELARAGDELSQESQMRGLIISEISQRIRIRWIALTIAVICLLFMAGLLIWASHWYFWGKFVTVPSPVAATMFLAPVVSITTITVMLAIGAFTRKGESMESAPVANLAAEGLRAASGSS
jgi:hypothetical protein